MRQRRIGYGLWLLLTAVLYFFENNTGTRILLLTTVMVPWFPTLRQAFLFPDEPLLTETAAVTTVGVFTQAGEDMPCEVREYRPGDPVRLIHWKLSAKRDALLVRSYALEPVPMEKPVTARSMMPASRGRGRLRMLPALAALCLALLLLIPEARLGAQALCNRLFRASEAVNAYVYEMFPVADSQSVSLAALLLTAASVLLTAAVALSRSGSPALGMAAALCLGQVYFGLSFPAWLNILLFGGLALCVLRRPWSRKGLLLLAALTMTASMAVALLLPGVDAATEAASEAVRDRLSGMTDRLAGVLPEEDAGETLTRHVFTQTETDGDREAQTGRSFRLKTVGEEQISMPHWVDYLKIMLLLLLTAVLLVLPFLPFLWLNTRRKRAREARSVFQSENVNEAVCAVFQETVRWL